VVAVHDPVDVVQHERGVARSHELLGRGGGTLTANDGLAALGCGTAGAAGTGIHGARLPPDEAAAGLKPAGPAADASMSARPRGTPTDASIRHTHRRAR